MKKLSIESKNIVHINQLGPKRYLLEFDNKKYKVQRNFWPKKGSKTRYGKIIDVMYLKLKKSSHQIKFWKPLVMKSMKSTNFEKRNLVTINHQFLQWRSMQLKNSF